MLGQYQNDLNIDHWKVAKKKGYALSSRHVWMDNYKQDCLLTWTIMDTLLIHIFLIILIYIELLFCNAGKELYHICHIWQPCFNSVTCIKYSWYHWGLSGHLWIFVSNKSLHPIIHSNRKMLENVNDLSALYDHLSCIYLFLN